MPASPDPGKPGRCNRRESLTRAVTVAVRERLLRVRAEKDGVAAERVDRLREIARDAAGRWVEPCRSAGHGDLLYDEVGMPG